MNELKRLNRIEKFYDKYICKKTLHRIEQITVVVAILSFIGNILLVFLNRTLETTPDAIAVLGTNYFSTIFTPFSVILYFEVFLLILAIPH